MIGSNTNGPELTDSIGGLWYAPDNNAVPTVYWDGLEHREFTATIAAPKQSISVVGQLTYTSEPIIMSMGSGGDILVPSINTGIAQFGSQGATFGYMYSGYGGFNAATLTLNGTQRKMYVQGYNTNAESSTTTGTTTIKIAKESYSAFKGWAVSFLVMDDADALNVTKRETARYNIE
jgi:hypothetical protein